MWLAVLLGCTNPSATSCDVLVRTGGLIPTEQACREEVSRISKTLAENGMYVRAQCYKIGKGEST
jgi:hypothetical protein